MTHRPWLKTDDGLDGKSLLMDWVWLLPSGGGWGHVMQREPAIFGTIPDFHRVQMLGVGDCSWYGDMVGGGVILKEHRSM